MNFSFKSKSRCKVHLFGHTLSLHFNHGTFSIEYPVISVWWGAVRTAGLAEGGRGGEDKKDGNMVDGNVDLICNEGY